ncbi:glycosyltransferase family 9 protein [Chloroflexota bacterium]
MKKILVYGYTGLGNFILFTPALKKLREVFPQAHITLQVGLDWGCEEAVRGSNLFDEIVWFSPSSGWRDRLKWYLKMRREGYDLIVTSFGGSSFPMQTCLSGARYRLGHVSGGEYRSYFDFIHNIKVPIQEGRHEIDLKCDLLVALGEQVTDRSLLLFIDEASRVSAMRLLESYGLSRKDYICLQPGAANMLPTAKKWSAEKFAALIKKIIEEINIDVVLLGDRNEMEVGRIFEDIVSDNKKVHILFGKTAVKEAAAIIQNSKLLICNDSGLMHVASAVGTPLVAIYGPTDYTRTAPRNDNNTIIRHEMECSPCIRFQGEKTALDCTHRSCINSITVEEVFNVIRTKLG